MAISAQTYLPLSHDFLPIGLYIFIYRYIEILSLAYKNTGYIRDYKNKYKLLPIVLSIVVLIVILTGIILVILW